MMNHSPKFLFDDYNWGEVFNFSGNARCADPNKEYNLSGFGVEDVRFVFFEDAGCNDGESWIIAGQLKDERYFFIDAWCDYTGWDCQSGGSCTIADSFKELVELGMTEEARERFGVNNEDLF